MTGVVAQVCKGYLNEVDTVLLPANGAVEPYLSPLELPSGCVGHTGVNLQGAVVPVAGALRSCSAPAALLASDGSTCAGSNFTVAESPQACCAQCAGSPACNTWVFCPAPEGCGVYTRFPRGTCSLKTQDAVAQGRPPLEFERGLDVPWISGVYNTAPAATQQA